MIKLWAPIVFLLTFSSFSQSEAALMVDLRKLGHQVLLAAGDSTSRVLPIEREFNRYLIHFNTTFSFDPTWMVNAAKSIFNGRNAKNHFILEVVDCESKAVVYSFESNPGVTQDLVPCMGRLQPEGCYSILVTFLNLVDNEKSVLTGTSKNETRNTLGNRPLVILLIFGGVISLIGMVFWLRKKPHDETKDFQEAIEIGEYQFFPASCRLTCGDFSADLTGKEAKLLQVLALNINQTVDRNFILKEVWEDEKGDYIGRTLDVYVSKLRKKLLADDKVSILNERGVGYSLVVE